MVWLNWVSAVAFLIAMIALLMSRRKQKPTLNTFLIVTLAFCMCLQFYLAISKTILVIRPQLDVQNLGTTPITIRHESGELSLTPGMVGAFRISRGDSLTLFAGEKTEGTFKTVIVNEGGARVRATAKADDKGQISFEIADAK